MKKTWFKTYIAKYPSVFNSLRMSLCRISLCLEGFEMQISSEKAISGQSEGFSLRGLLLPQPGQARFAWLVMDYSMFVFAQLIPGFKLFPANSEPTWFASVFRVCCLDLH